MSLVGEWDIIGTTRENSSIYILDDFYNFIIQYFDFNKIDENSMMDGKLLPTGELQSGKYYGIY